MIAFRQMRARPLVTRPALVPRLAGFGTTIFAEMSALAVATGSINLGQGFPDTDGPAEVADAAIAAIRAGHNQYPPGPGHPRAAGRDRRRTSSTGTGSTYDPDTEVLVTAGATEAIAATLLALCDAGDEVVVFEPYYDSYAACIAMAGGVRTPGHAPHARLRVRPRRAPRRDHPAHEAAVAQLAAQPDRQGVRPRRARADRGAVRGARPRRDHRRGVRAPHVRRRRARPARDAPRHARPHDHDLLGGQDVLVHGLEDRLGVRVARPARRGAHRQAVPHLRERRAVPARDRHRARSARRVLHRVRRRPRRRGAICSMRRACAPRGSRCSRRGAPTS